MAVGALSAGAIALLIAGCSSTPSSTPSDKSSGSTSTAALPKSKTCTSSDDYAKTFKLGTFLPLTGSLAYLGPAAVSGSGQALSEIDKAGGVNGVPTCVISTDSSDTDNPTIGDASIKQLLQAKVSAVLGAESSSVTKNVMDQVFAAETVMLSPANTADDLSGVSKWYFRTAPPNAIEANALGNLILGDGYTKVAVLVFNDAYGTNLRDGIQKVVESGGGKVVYGASGAGQDFPSTETSFGSIVSAALATNPDAIVIDAFDQTKAIIPALASAGWDMKKSYLIDGNLADFSKDFDPGTMTGAQATAQGVNPNDKFKATLRGWYKKNAGKSVDDFGYGAEAYDGTILMALAAQKGGSSDPATIQKNLAAVSGTTNGTKCKTYAACLALVKGGKEIQYTGPSGVGPFNDKQDPSTGYISVYKYGNNNNYTWQSSVKG
ncbi:MAG: ABC transporter substrate-binding protein [Micrococcales bacterium]|nr:ABC transporter substrate-binding protein [Micrococcales bacterium]